MSVLVTWGRASSPLKVICTVCVCSSVALRMPPLEQTRVAQTAGLALASSRVTYQPHWLVERLHNSYSGLLTSIKYLYLDI